MESKLAGLFNGDEQIGGLLDWEFEVIFAQFPDGKGHIVYKFVKWILTAPSYWLFKKTDSVVIRLYCGNRYWEGEGNIISTPSKAYNTMLHEPIEIMGEEQLVDKK